MTEKKNNPSTLLSAFDEDLKSLERRIGKDRSASTWRSMLQSRNYVEAFLKYQYQQDDILLDKIAPQLIRDFSIYLSMEHGLMSGTVWLACQQLKGVVTRACQRGKVMWNPFAGFHISRNTRPREYLSEEELSRLLKHESGDSTLDFTRDVFVFAAFTGLSFVDMQTLRHSDIVEMNGGKWIFSRRHKTRVPYQVKLMEIPMRIIRKYGNDGEYVFGDMNYRTMVKRLHRVMEEVGIRKRISFHAARHTFAVMAINNGMPIESLSRILGHTKITTTQIYAKITTRKLDEDITYLARKLKF